MQQQRLQQRKELSEKYDPNKVFEEEDEDDEMFLIFYYTSNPYVEKHSKTLRCFSMREQN